MAPPNPSGLTPPDLRPIVQTDAEKIIAAVNAAFTPPARGSNVATVPALVPLAGTPTVVATVTVTPTRVGSKLQCVGNLGGSNLAPGLILANLHVAGDPSPFGQGGSFTTDGIGGGAGVVPVVGEIDSGTPGVPITITLIASAAGADWNTAPGVSRGVGLLVQEVGGT